MALHIFSKNYPIITLAVVFISLGILLFSLERPLAPAKDGSGETEAIQDEPLNITAGPVSPLTGESCAGAERRPIGVMLAGDAVTRPLAGISQADLVIEMPVITNGITRYLAIFACETPAEIGSVRSARDDFIPLAKGFDVIFGHWGGSHFALSELKSGVIDNINALTNPFGAYFRKPGITEPHNGFATWDKLVAAAQKLNYRLTTNLKALWPRHEARASTTKPAATLRIPYPGQFRAAWVYDPKTNTYERLKGGTPELDANTKKAVTASVIVVLRTDIEQIEGQYNDVRVFGKGRGVVYQDGEFFEVTWQKADDAKPLQFLTIESTQLPLAPGKVWLEYIDDQAAVSYEVAEAIEIL